MTRDWLLTLLALSPYFLAVTILLLALAWKLTQVHRERHVPGTVVSRARRDRMDDARSIPIPPHDRRAVMENT